MRVAMRMMIAKGEEIFMGPGTKMLLERIQRYSSIRGASQSMDMSYTKALKMLRTMEKELGFPIVHSEKGGIDRGHTDLTANGERILQVYREVEQEVLTYAQQRVDEKFAYLE